MSQTTIESDPLFQLLTDALRSGPGTPEWHQAVLKLREGGLTHSDEYRLLVTVREHLESGRDYRSIAAGQGFTRKLFDQIEKEPAESGTRRPGLPMANIIALVSAVAIVLLLAFLAWQLIPRGTPDGPRPGIEELAGSYFPTEMAGARFETGILSTWPPTGQLPLEASRGALRPAANGTPTTLPATGGVAAPVSVPANEPFAVEVQVRPGRTPNDDVILEVYVSTDASPDPRALPNELVWLIQGKTQRVVLSGQKQKDAPRPEQAKPEEPVSVRILVNGQVAIIEVNKQRIWSGPHGLPAQPRHAGIRFIRAGKTPESPGVVSMRVMKK